MEGQEKYKRCCAWIDAWRRGDYSALQYLLYVFTDKVTGKDLHIHCIFALTMLQVDWFAQIQGD